MAKCTPTVPMGSPVVLNKGGVPHAATVIKTHDDDPCMACLVYYCPVTHAWQEEMNATFGTGEGQYSNVCDDCDDECPSPDDCGK